MSISFDASLGGDYELYKNDSHLTTKDSSPINDIAAKGSHSYKLRRCVNGVCGSFGAPKTIHVENQIPTIISAEPKNDDLYTTSQPVVASIEGVDPDGTVELKEFKLNSGGWQTSGNFGKLSKGNHSISFRIADDEGAYSEIISRQITVKELVAPIINSSGLLSTVNPGKTISMSLKANDSDTAQGDLTWSISASPQKGTASISSSGSVTYTASANESGEDSLTVKVEDKDGLSDTAVVRVSLNSAPVITQSNTSTVSVNAGASSNFVLTANDSDTA